MVYASNITTIIPKKQNKGTNFNILMCKKGVLRVV